MQRRKTALMFAKRFRTCPPLALARDSSQKSFFDLHLSICPYCAAEAPEKAESWQGLAEGIRDVLMSEPSSVRTSPPDAGDIRPIRADLSRWKDGFFYNPPVVAVIEPPRTISGAVLVAQTYHDSALAGPGDLILDGDRSPIGEIFVEPWNTYTLRGVDLGPAVGKVGSEVIEAVRALDGDPAAYPEWAMHPRPMAAEDLRIYFREMEVEVGYVFASESVSALMAEVETPILRLVYRAPEEAIRDIEQKTKDVYWSFVPETIELVLVTAQFPPERYAMAAAAAEQVLFKANLVTARAGRVMAVVPIEGEVLQREAGPEGFVIGGRLFLPNGIEISGLLCFLQTREGRFIPPQSLDWHSKGSFLATFEAQTMIDGEIFMAAIQETADD